MNYTLMSSLEHFALVKTAITLWNQDDVQALFARCDMPMSNTSLRPASLNEFSMKERWVIAENKVIEKVQELPLPESLKKKVLAFIKPIGIEIFEWMVHLEDILSNTGQVSLRTSLENLVRKSFEKLCWTPQGTVDRRKTAEGLIRDEDLDITECYKLACNNCLENDILMLWIKMPNYCKKSFYSEEGPRCVNQDKLVVLWTYDIKGEVTRMYNISEEKWTGCTPYQYAFVYAVSSGNKPATEHFLQKLTSEEREESLKRSLPLLPNKGTLYYLLSQMKEVQQVGMFRVFYTHQVLICLLDWPLQSLFLKVAKHLLTYISKHNYCYLLEAIIGQVSRGFKDYNYQKLFREFWQQGPLTYKEYITHTINAQYLLRKLLYINDIENVKLILKDVTIADKEKIIFSDNGKDICEELIYVDEMDFLEWFIQECISSKDLMIKFREEFERYISDYSKARLEGKKDLWSKVCQLQNNLTQKFDKRSCVEEGNNGPVKRLFSLASE